MSEEKRWPGLTVSAWFDRPVKNKSSFFGLGLRSKVLGICFVDALVNMYLQSTVTHYGHTVLNASENEASLCKHIVMFSVHSMLHEFEKLTSLQN